MLENMSVEQWRSLPGNAPKKKKAAGHVAEKKVLKACLQWLAIHGIMAWRNNTGQFEAKDKYGNPRFVAFGAIGSGDIIGILPPYGIHFEIETKSTGKTLSKGQQQRKCMVETAGGIYIEAHSVDDLSPLLEMPYVGEFHD